MIQALPKPLTFEEFVAWLPETGRYELIDGIVVEMQPTGPHEEVTEFISTTLTIEANRLQLPYRFPRRALVRAISWETGYLPDVLVVDRQALVSEPQWKRAATITQGTSIKLVAEVISTSWETDYARKLEDYEAMGIQEYWLCDYLGLGGRRYIGSPKQPTFSVYQLQPPGEYQVKQFRGEQVIESLVFPELLLSLNQILRAVSGQGG
jgi:Uma2 family endonuclease